MRRFLVLVLLLVGLSTVSTSTFVADSNFDGVVADGNDYGTGGT